MCSDSLLANEAMAVASRRITPRQFPLTLSVSVSDPNADPMTVTFYGRVNSAPRAGTGHPVLRGKPHDDLPGPDQLDRQQLRRTQYRVCDRFAVPASIQGQARHRLPGKPVCHTTRAAPSSGWRWRAISGIPDRLGQMIMTALQIDHAGLAIGAAPTEPRPHRPPP